MEKTIGSSEGATKLSPQDKHMENNDNKMVQLERVAWSLRNIFKDGVDEMMRNASCFRFYSM